MILLNGFRNSVRPKVIILSLTKGGEGSFGPDYRSKQ